MHAWPTNLGIAQYALLCVLLYSEPSFFVSSCCGCIHLRARFLLIILKYTSILTTSTYLPLTNLCALLLVTSIQNQLLNHVCC